MSARRKMVLATLRQLNSRRMEELVRMRLLEREDHEIDDRYYDDKSLIRYRKGLVSKSIKSLRNRLSYEFESNKDLLEPSHRDDESDS